VLRGLPNLEELDELRFSATTTLFTRDGLPMADWASVEDGRSIARTVINLTEVSPAAVAAVVVSEDQRFFQHYGIDFIRLAGGLYYTLRGDLQGGSSITTQVVKNTVLKELAGVRGLERKLKEFPMALELERRYAKEEILEMYLNVVPWGGNAQGIQAAARAYFDKEPSQLTLAEGAYLAILIPRPNPRYLDMKNTRRRMRILLRNMVEGGWISQEEAAAALQERLTPRGWEANYDEAGNLTYSKLVNPELRIQPDLQVRMAPHFVFAVQKYLREKLGSERLRKEGGLRVYTTLDRQMQTAAENAIAGGKYPRDAEAAIVGMDPNSGEVYAMVGGRSSVSLNRDSFNRATQAWRSPGSSIKPFLFATALEAGWTQATTVRDSPVEYPDPSRPGKFWRPGNFDDTYLDRPVTIRYALDRSLNLPAIRTLEAIGLARYQAKLKTAGFRVSGDLANAIGGGIEITPLLHAAAYSAFVNGGYWIEPKLVTKVEDDRGRVFYQPDTNRVLLFSPQVAYQTWDMLKGYVYDQKGRSLAKEATITGRIVGGKTGTSQEAKDLWFAGATRGLVATLWIGRDDNKPQRLSNGSEPSSSFVNPPIWKNFVEEALRGRSTGDFPRPSGLVAGNYDLLTGNPSSAGIAMLFQSNPVRRQQQETVEYQSYVNPLGPAISYETSSQNIGIDRTTGCLAEPEAPSENIQWIQVPEDQVDRYRCS
jgi:membrane peptidoglycan carboxypeptidase